MSRTHIYGKSYLLGDARKLGVSEQPSADALNRLGLLPPM